MIQISGLTKSFGEKQVLSGVDMTIPNGKTSCVIGKSGCGKSVLLKHIVGLLVPDSGEVTVDGFNIQDLNQESVFNLRRTIGFVFQGAALFDSYTVYQNIIINMYEHGEQRDEILEAEAKKVLSSVGLLPNLEEQESANFKKEWKILKDKKPSDLSGGMRKRVGVARALVGSPKYIFYDEPTTGLDPVTSEQIDDLIRDIAIKFNTTSIVITHDMFSVYRIADQVFMLDDGKVVFNGDSIGLRKSNNPVVQEFIKRFN